jgi:hypothetical protein
VTTIAANRKCMAADSNCKCGDAFFQGSPKIIRVGKTLIGAAGDVSAIDKFLGWYKRGRKGRKPEFRKKEDLYVLLLSPKGLFMCNEDLAFEEIHSPYYAIGTGNLCALVAMDLGATPHGAIEAACRRDPDNTKGPVLVMNL